MAYLKSIGAVLAGFISVAVLSIGTDMILEYFGILPSEVDAGAALPWVLAIALLYRSIYTVVGGYITAWLAPGNNMNHIYGLMVLGGIGGVAGAIGGWEYGQHWYPILLAITGPLFVWAGGKFYVAREL